MGCVGHDVRSFTPSEAVGLPTGGASRPVRRARRAASVSPQVAFSEGFNPAGDTGSDWANEGASPVLSHARSRCASPAGDHSPATTETRSTVHTGVDESYEFHARADMLPRTRSSPTRSGRLAAAIGVVVLLAAAVGVVVWEPWHGPVILSLSTGHGIDAGDLVVVPLVALAIYIGRRRITAPACRLGTPAVRRCGGDGSVPRRPWCSASCSLPPPSWISPIVARWCPRAVGRSTARCNSSPGGRRIRSGPGHTSP